MLLLDAVYFSHRENHSTLQLLDNLFHELDHGAIFWLLLSGGHCPQLVDDMNAPAALMVHHVGTQDVEVGRKLDFPLRTRSIVDRLNDSIGTPGRAHRCRTSFGLSPSPQKKHSFGNRSAGAAGDSRRRALAAKRPTAFHILALRVRFYHHLRRFIRKSVPRT
ncbi:hypothetical protein GWK47_005300 [Chionoecetes opilio]|uniref:Uncharacterized protein n=1 Tax=Chionoecetes opilio TaxID=41210 RepID=A0A8J5D0I0_CHIOP|nr:hypothetical protein GWK47_005300 [Chionoecetes opilio]